MQDTTKRPALMCTQVSKWGIRAEIGRSSYLYTPKTDYWLGRHNGGSFAIYLVHGNINLGVRCVLTSTNPKTDLLVDGKLLTTEARVNPIKVEYSAGYSLNLKYNFCLEPYVAITSNKFYVVNEDSLGKHYQIPQVAGFTAGIGLNKYFRLKEFQFMSVFVRYGHGFSNFKKVNNDLGTGYSEWSFGVAYKGFAKKCYTKLLQNTDGLLSLPRRH